VDLGDPVQVTHTAALTRAFKYTRPARGE
jgi:hypothetical protein